MPCTTVKYLHCDAGVHELVSPSAIICLHYYCATLTCSRLARLPVVLILLLGWPLVLVAADFAMASLSLPHLSSRTCEPTAFYLVLSDLHHVLPTPRCQVSGPDRDVHSGNDGGVFNEPMVDLSKLLSNLTASNTNTVAIPGFYDDVRPRLIDLAWAGLENSDEFQMSNYR